MPLANLPKELLIEIIKCSLPEGFEGLALTCKPIHRLCEPFMKTHNHLRRQYQTFRQMEAEDPGRPYRKACAIDRDDPCHPMRTALDLIKRIAIQPEVARYIEIANLDRDSIPPRARRPQIIPDAVARGPLMELFSSSSYLAEAGLDWQEYYATLEEQCKRRQDYSQHAAVFLLTLLPNVKTLILPRMWVTNTATDKLLEVITQNANLPHASSNAPSLAQVIRVGWIGNSQCYDTELSRHFLALPRARHFMSTGFHERRHGPIRHASQSPYQTFGENLETIHLHKCSLGETDIAKLLKRTSRLKTLFYSHSIGAPYNWDICAFISAIEREAGGHLIELYVSIWNMAGSILPGKLSMQGFQVLQRLALPLEIAMCDTGCKVEVYDHLSSRTITLSGNHMADEEVPVLTKHLPPSVSEFVLNTRVFDDSKWQLSEALSRQFAVYKESRWPNVGNTQPPEKVPMQISDEEDTVHPKVANCLSHWPNIEWQGKWQGIRFPPHNNFVERDYYWI